MRRIVIMFSITVMLMSCMAQIKYPKIPKSTNRATIEGKIQYPYKFKYEGNPLSRMHSATDPDVQVYNGEVWVYCGQDRKMDSINNRKGYDTMDGYHVFSSKDMVNWTDHGEILHSSDVSWANGGFLWAPGSAYKNGKYYLYYPLKDKSLQWKIGVAIGDTPAGPFKDTGKPIEGIGGIDPKIFIDDDGQAYIYNNPGIMAKLKPNMIELAEPTQKVMYGTPEIMSADTTRFSEGSYMHKRNGIYYYSYTCLRNKNTHGMYAMGKSPYGPWEWKGPLAPKPKPSGQDHHSIIEFKGQWYYFYHVAFPKNEFPKYKEGQGRIVCVDKLFYNADGTIQLIKHTLGE